MKLLSIFVGIAFSFVAYADELKVTGDVDFKASAPLVNINGTGSKLTGTVTVDGTGVATGSFDVDLTKATTDNGLRDEHMHTKYLDTGKFPKATLKLEPVKATAAEFAWKGSLTLKGVTKPVSGKGKYNDGKLWASFKVSLKEFSITGVSWKDAVVSDEAEVIVQAQAGK